MRALIVAALGLLVPWPGPARAQEGPSFNCRYAATATEVAICDSPRLSRIERVVVQAYEEMASRIGATRARQIADTELFQRQACGGAPKCIEDRLVASLGVFIANSGGPIDPAPAAIPPDAVAAPITAPAVEETVALAPIPEPATGAIFGPISRPPSRPARRAPADLPLVLSPEARLALGPPVVRREVPFPEAEDAPDIEEAPDDPLPQAALAPFPEDLPEPSVASAEPAEAPAAAPQAVAPPTVAPPTVAPSTALGEAFAALPLYRRVNIQGRLAEAGYGGPDASGEWGLVTAAALAAFSRDAAEAGGDFDPSTAEGAAGLLRFIDSDSFRQAILGEEVVGGG